MKTIFTIQKLTMNFHPLPILTEFEEAYIESSIDEILGHPNPFVQSPAITVLSFLREEPHLSPWFARQIQERVMGQRFLHSPQHWAMPMRLSLNEFVLQ